MIFGMVKIMFRKLIPLLILVSVFGSFCFGDTYFQDSGNHTWSDAANWDSGIPDSGTSVWNTEDSTQDKYCVIDGASKSAFNVKAGNNGGKNSKYVMNEGTLTIDLNLEIAWVINSDGAIFEMNGGTINIGNKLFIGRHRDKKNVNPAAQFYFNDGVIEAVNMIIGSHTDTKLRMSEGAVLKLQYDRTQEIQNYIDSGKIVSSYGDRTKWTLDYNTINPGFTTFYVEENLDKAWNPSPSDGARNVSPNPSISWTSGEQMEQEKLYFSKDKTAVTEGNASADKGLVISLFTPDLTLELGETYYWRIDTINNSIPQTWEGDVWSFTVEDFELTGNYIVIDNFEYYIDESDLLNKWKDGTANGTGSTISLESGTDYVQSASQALKFNYSNTKGGDQDYSQISKTFSSPKNWEESGISSLSLILHGSKNDLAPLYVILEDQDGYTAQVNYPDPSKLIQLSWEEFIEWNIDMKKFRNQGVDTQRIKTIYIGTGDRNGATASASGDIYINDIRLYLPRYIQEKFPANLNPGHDKAIDFIDLGILSDQWMNEGFTVTATDPGESDLQLHYKFEDVSGSNVTDSSSNGFDGSTSDGLNHYDPAGKIDGCINFDGTFGVIVPSSELFNVAGFEDQITIAMWVKAKENFYPKGDWGILFQGGAWKVNNTNKRYITGYCPTLVMPPNNPTNRNVQILFRTSPDGSIGSADDVFYQNAGPEDWGNDSWVHFAFVKYASEGKMYIYRNGVLIAANEQANSQLNVDAIKSEGFNIGRISVDDLEYHGKMDDFRIYNRALSQAEIAHLAGKSSVYQPLRSIADIDDSARVEMGDFVAMVRTWSEQLLWPSRKIEFGSSDKLTGIEKRHGHYFYSPSEYADQLVNEGAETVTIGLLDGKGRSCYNSDYLPMVSGIEEDYIPTLISELKDRNIRTYGWVTFNTQDLHQLSDFIYDELCPDWQMEFLGGDEIQDDYKGMCVISSPFIQEHAKVLRECAALDIDGFFFDGFYLMGIPHPGVPGCTCQYCQNAFQNDTGLELPQEENWDDPSFKKWVRWRNKKLLQVARYFQTEMREVDPYANIRVNLNTWPFIGKDWETGIPLWRIDDLGVSQHGFSKQFYEKLMMLGYKCRLSFDLNPANCDVWRHSRKTDTSCGKEWDPLWHELELRLFMLAGLSYGVVPWRAPGNDIPDNESILLRINNEMKEKENYFSKDYISSVAVVNSQNTFDFYGHRNLPDSIKDYKETVIGAWMLLTENHIPFSFLFDDQLREAIDENIKTIIMPDTAAISQTAMENIEQWVNKGGQLIATSNTALYDEWGNLRNTSLLESMFGIDTGNSYENKMIGQGRVIYFAENSTLSYCRTRDSDAEMIINMLSRKNQAFDITAPSTVISNAFYGLHKEKIYLHLLNTSVLMENGENFYHGEDNFVSNSEITFPTTDDGQRTIGYPFEPVDNMSVKFNDVQIKSAKKVSSGEILAVTDNNFNVSSAKVHEIIEIELD